MKKLLLLIFSLNILVGCVDNSIKENNLNTKNDTTTKYKDFTLEFDNKKCNSKEKVIHTFADGRKIYSRCGNVYYVSGDNKKTLSDALNNNDIEVTDITSRMEAILGVYDGGTIVYEYKSENNVLGKNNFRFEKCNVIDGSKDMLFLSNKSDNYKCA